MRIKNNIFTVASLTLYVLSCFLPCFYVEDKENIYYGYYVLLLGWAGVLIHSDIRIYFIAWYANVLYFMALLLCKYKVSILLSCLAFIISLFFGGCPYVVIDEAGHISHITKLDIGYVIWIISIFLLFISSYITKDRRDY